MTKATTTAVLTIMGVTALYSGAAPAAGRGQDAQRFIAVQGDEFAITNVRLIDGTGAAPRDDQTVVVREGRIAEIGPANTVRTAADAEVINGAGHTLIPGIVGMHDHTFYTAHGGRAAQLSTTGPIMYLASGVTTIRTTGAQSPYEEINLKTEIDAGRRIGPRMIVAGPYFTGQSADELDMVRVDGAEGARRLVRYWAEEGVGWFKAYTRISRAELGAAIDEAHKHGLKVTAHLCSVTFREAVALGIDNVEHGLYGNSDYAEGKQPDECPDNGSFSLQYVDLDIDSPEVRQTFREMIDAGVAMTSTLAINENYVSGRPPIDQRSLDMLAPEIAAAVKERNAHFVSGDEGSEPPELWQKYLEYEAAFVRAGGLLGAGVDPTGYGAALPGFGDQRNFELLREADFTPQQAIQILSANGAKILAIAEETGSIEVGKLAEMVLLSGDLVADPASIRNVTIVFKDGVGYDSMAMLESIKGQVGIH